MSPPRRHSAPPVLERTLGSGPPITSSKTRKTQLFTNQKTGQAARSLHTVADCLTRVAGSSHPEEVGKLLTAFLASKHGKYSKQVIEETLVTNKLNQVVENIKLLHAQTPTNDRNTVLSTITRVIPRRTLNCKYEMGISATSYAKSRARDIGAYPRKRRHIGNEMSQENVNLIKDFFYKDEVTREAANRTVKIGATNEKVAVAVRYLQDTKSNLHREFIEKHFYLSRKSFDKYTPKEVKKCKRDTDKCIICAEGIKLRQSVTQLETIACRSLDQDQELAKALKDLKAIDEHIVLQQEIRSVFKEQKRELPVGAAIIVMDFKENMKLGKAAVETSRNFYDTPQRSVFTIAVYTRENESRVVEDDLLLTYFTFVSETLKHDTRFVFECLKKAQAHPRWQGLNIHAGKEINFWVDNAPQHFRTFECMYEFQAFAMRNPRNRVHLNYFAEYHGKCVCDSHFSLLSRYYRDYSMHADSGQAIYTTKEFIKLLQMAVRKSNEAKCLLNTKKKAETKALKPLCVIFMEYSRPAITTERLQQVKTANFTSFYHFEVLRTSDETNRFFVAHPYRGHELEHKYPIVVVESDEEVVTSKQGWTESRAKPFSAQSLHNKEKFRQKISCPKLKRASRRRNGSTSLSASIAQSLVLPRVSASVIHPSPNVSIDPLHPYATMCVPFALSSPSLDGHGPVRVSDSWTGPSSPVVLHYPNPVTNHP